MFALQMGLITIFQILNQPFFPPNLVIFRYPFFLKWGRPYELNELKMGHVHPTKTDGKEQT